MSSWRLPRPQTGGRIKVMVVDDSVVFRKIITDALKTQEDVDVVGTAPNGAIALQRIAQLNPDLITLDIEMPQMDGLTTLRELRKTHPKIRVIMCSTLTERGAAVSLEALSAGADDYITKSATGANAADTLRVQIVQKVRQFFSAPATPPVPVTTRQGARAIEPRAGRPAPRCVAIGVSTGGPNALAEVIPAIPRDFPVPIYIVQHMPPMFTRLLAERLRSLSKVPVHEATQGMVAEAGNVYLAPGDYHMCVQQKGTDFALALNQDAPENFCRPAVDVLFRSVASAYGGATVATILTGMGQDGFRGVESLHHLGAYVVAQDEATSVVWGMPGFVARAGLADAVCPLKEIATTIVRQFR